MSAKPKSIFRYPGGKYKAINYIKPFWEQVEHSEYREPFVGGGSVFIAKPLVENNWINDVNKDLIAFYKIISDKKKREKLIKDLLNVKISKKSYDGFYFSKPKNDFDKAKRYYILNRCSFSGITMWNSFIGDVRYNIQKAQETIRDIGEKLSNTEVTSLDFEEVIKSKPKKKNGKVFMFLDPPYAESRQIVAYNHSFTKDDHIRLAKLLKETKHHFLLTYDDCEFVRDLYDWAHFYSRTWTYSVANSRTHHNPREKGNELFISNFKLQDPVELNEEK
jgi:DNA adenine methylase